MLLPHVALVIFTSAEQLSAMVSKAGNATPGHGAVKGNKPSKSFKSEDVENLMKTITKLTGSTSNSDAKKVGKSGVLSSLEAVIKKPLPPVNSGNNVQSKSAGKIITNAKKFVTTSTAKSVETTSKTIQILQNKATVPMGSEKRAADWWLLPNGTPKVPQLQIGAESSWYSTDDHMTALRTLENSKRLTVDSSRLSIITSAVMSAFESEVSAYQSAKGSKMSGDQKWINDVLKSGTLSDKVAALALVVQESPIHELSALDTLIGLASKKEYRTSQLALEAVKDLLIHNLLPDRGLVSFKNQPFNHPDMTIERAMLYWYEEQLYQRVELIANALDIGLKSTIEFFKKQCMDIAAELLTGKPEKEARFLAMIVNKLGDPSGAVGSKCIELLRNVIRKHPAMKCVVVREVRQLIYRPNLPVRTVHSGIVFLSQVPLVKGDHDVAAQLVECYMSLFEKAVTQDELGSRLLSSLLSGLDRAFPFLNNKEPIAKHVDSLFRIIHSASFSTSTRALLLISHIALAHTDEDEAKKSVNGLSAKIVKSVSDDETHLVRFDSLIKSPLRSFVFLFSLQFHGII